ncbi:uncharacterized protein G2W53_036643 [Senna tora]|uniref:Uncharacterized protein n=1 Tax=Senna tora TaxID=362788 RepID=A0A834W507_9FABA|nr:uncharacterized protein G2W53_036643 [Senna tora]
MIARARQWRRARKESMMQLLKVSVTSMGGVDDSTSYVVATSKEGVNDAASGDKRGRFQLHARKESTMALSKVPVTCVEGVIDDTKVLETCMEDFNDVTTNGSRDKCERVDDVTHPSWLYQQAWKELVIQKIPGSNLSLCSVSDNNQDVEEFDDACEQRQQGRARGCVEGFDDGATEDFDNHTKKDGTLCALKDALTECGKCLTFIRSGGDDQPWMLGMSKGTSLLSARGGERLQTLGMSKAGGSMWLLFFCWFPWSHTLALLVLEWRSLAISLLMLAMKFSICGGEILCLQQVDASWNIPSKALLGSSRSIERSRYDELVTGYFVVRDRLSFLMMLSEGVEEMTSWLPATLSFVLTCHFFDE